MKEASDLAVRLRKTETLARISAPHAAGNAETTIARELATRY
jgi:hypothetical protein